MPQDPNPPKSKQTAGKAANNKAARKDATGTGSNTERAKQLVPATRSPPTPRTGKKTVQPAAQTPVAGATPTGAGTPGTGQKQGKAARRNSVMNLRQLVQDGRKKPEHYRKLVQEASSPSQISFHNITEFYEPSYEFFNVEDVYTYRGYKKVAKLDEGAFGVVYKALRIGDRKNVALKEVDLSKKRSKRIEEMKRELYVLQKLDSPFIVKLIEHFVAGHTLVIIMEFCQGSNLTNHLKDKNLDEEDIKFLFKQMASGIKLMHRNGIAHRDVKLNNFLLDSTKKNVKIADFGLSVVSYKPDNGLQLCKTYCGTEPYMAPEIIRRNSRGFRQYNPYNADIWALGVCLYAMLTKTFPFKLNLSQRSLYKNQRERRWRIAKVTRDKISEELNDLIWHMLDPEPDRRITINGILTHPWFNPDPVTLSKDES
jgi:serine/threonine protein kinase